MSCEDTQHKHNKLDFSSKNQIEWLKPYTCIVKLYAHAYFRKYAPEYAKSFCQRSHSRRHNEETSTRTAFVSSPWLVLHYSIGVIIKLKPILNYIFHKLKTPNVYTDTCQGDEMKSVSQFCIMMNPNLIISHFSGNYSYFLIYNNVSQWQFIYSEI